jgi:ankyrin repeat protein
MFASGYGHLKVVQALLAKGADVNAKNEWGGTALDITRSREVKELLIKAGAKKGWPEFLPLPRPDKLPESR